MPGIADAARRVGRIKRVNGWGEILAGSRFPGIPAVHPFIHPTRLLPKDFSPQKIPLFHSNVTKDDSRPSPPLLASFQNETQIVVELENIVHFRWCPIVKSKMVCRAVRYIYINRYFASCDVF